MIEAVAKSARRVPEAKDDHRYVKLFERHYTSVNTELNQRNGLKLWSHFLCVELLNKRVELLFSFFASNR